MPLIPSLLACALSLSAATPQPEPSAPKPAAQPATRLILEARTRAESLNQTGADASAVTTRVRLGLVAPLSPGLTGLVELEGVAALADTYADGIRPDRAHAVIADPEIVELNRAQLTWSPSRRGEVVAGRQRIVLGSSRFVGNSGWRQNEQTFDALKFTIRPRPNTALTYAYVGRVLRSTGRDHPQGRWKGDVHLIQGETATPVGQALIYAYLMDFSAQRAQSSATIGARLVGSRPMISALALTWELDVARQTDWGSNPADFALGYQLAAAGVKTKTGTLAVVYERLEGDGKRGLLTPLGSGHGFQGWSDVIAATPANGVRDIFLRGALTGGGAKPFKLAGEAHDFRSDDGHARLGRELDLSVQKPLTKPVTLEAGVAHFATRTGTYPDATRAWVALEYRY